MKQEATPQTDIVRPATSRSTPRFGNETHNTPVRLLKSGLYYGQQTTPVRHTKCRGNGPSSGTVNTPLSIKASQEFSNCQNPFEAGLLDRLCGPVFSPDCFKTSTPGTVKTPVTFKWSVDDLAILKPADIRVSPAEELCCCWHNAEVEEKAQKAIDFYFSRNVILPSPWTDSAKKKSVIRPEHADVISPTIDNKPKCNEVASQTELSLPKDFDLQSILADYYNKKDSTSDVPDMLDSSSNSSLRRKLFFHTDDDANRVSTPHSGDVMMDVSEQRNDSLYHSNQELFSSSPIRDLHMTPTIRRCSTAPQLLESPLVSPIKSCYVASDNENVSHSHEELFSQQPDVCFKVPLLLDAEYTAKIADDSQNESDMSALNSTTLPAFNRYVTMDTGYYSNSCTQLINSDVQFDRQKQQGITQSEEALTQQKHTNLTTRFDGMELP